MTKLSAAYAVLLAGALLFAVGALVLADRIVASLGLVLMAVSAAIDAAKAA